MGENFFDRHTSHPAEEMTQREMQTGKRLSTETVAITLLGDLPPDSLIASLI